MFLYLQFLILQIFILSEPVRRRNIFYQNCKSQILNFSTKNVWPCVYACDSGCVIVCPVIIHGVGNFDFGGNTTFSFAFNMFGVNT